MTDINQWLQDNQLVEHDLLQGTPEWVAFRLEHDGASEAAVMLGISDLATRTELLDAKSTGISKEFSDWVQEHILDNGHRVEALARPIIEKQCGIKLYPVVYSRGKPSASCDGITMAGTIGWEHKQWNQELAEAVAAGNLPDKYMAQPQQCLLLTGADKWIFTVSDGTEARMVSMEIYPDRVWFVRILNGWAQFNKDRETHVPKVIAERPKAEAIMDLPALSVQATGMVTYSNLPEFKAAAESYIANINTELVTDQQFADAEATVKFCKATEEKLEVTKAAILAQTATIDEVIRTVDYIQAHLRDKRLMLDKLVKSEKEARKAAMVAGAREKFYSHCESLGAEVKQVQLDIAIPDFAGAVKGLKSLSSMHDALDTALANAKIEADAIAKDVRAKLAWCKENATDMSFLLPDLQQIIAKPLDDFTLTITSRIKEHKEAEARKEAEIIAKAEADAAAKLNAERARIQAEEEAKAKAAQDALLTAETETLAHQESAAIADQIRPARPSDTEQAALLAVRSNDWLEGEMTYEQKALGILRAMAHLAADGKRLTIAEDYGFGSATVIDHDGAHTHVGCDCAGSEQANFEAFVSQLHGLLVAKRGLSWVKPLERKVRLFKREVNDEHMQREKKF